MSMSMPFQQMEKPAGIRRNMTGHSVLVYTQEQQARLGVTENGTPIQRVAAPQVQTTVQTSVKSAMPPMRVVVPTPTGSGIYSPATPVPREQQQARPVVVMDSTGTKRMMSSYSTTSTTSVPASPGPSVQTDMTPAWTRGEMERPAGLKNMGAFMVSVFTPEQQARLGVDESGNPRPMTPTVSVPASPTLSHASGGSLRTSIEPPNATKNMGNRKILVYSEEQQRRLNVDETGRPRASSLAQSTVSPRSVASATPASPGAVGVEQVSVRKFVAATQSPPKVSVPNGPNNQSPGSASYSNGATTTSQPTQAQETPYTNGVTNGNDGQVLYPAGDRVPVEKPQDVLDCGLFSIGVYSKEQQARLGVDFRGAVQDSWAPQPKPRRAGPQRKEKPRGMKIIGDYAVPIYTPEQQARLGVDERGLTDAPKVSPPPGLSPGGLHFKEKPQGVQDKGSYSVGCYTAEQQARLGVDSRGMVRDSQAPISLKPHKPPMKEKPRGMKDMGSYAVSVYTAEQQARLGVDSRGAKLIQESPQPRRQPGDGRKEKPQGFKDMGSYSVPVYTAEQQARLCVDERGAMRDPQAPMSRRAHRPVRREKPRGMKDMGAFAVSVYTSEQQARLGVDSRGVKLDQPSVQSRSVGHGSSGKEKPQGSKDMGSYSVPVYTAEQQARLGVDERGLVQDPQAPVTKKLHKPAKKEKPRGMKDMGSYAVSVYTSEQQARLGIDARGAKLDPLVPSAGRPARGPIGKEKPEGTKDMGSYSVPIFTPEQQARLGVDERGVVRDSQAPVAKKVHRPPMKEKPRGMKDMGSFAVSVYTAEQQARLGVDSRGAKVIPEPARARAVDRGSAGKEKPQGTKDMGSFSVPVFTPEQQARLGVDERGVIRDPQAPVAKRAHRPPMKEKPRGMKDMGSYAVSVYTSEQQARLGVDSRGAKLSPEVPQSRPAAAQGAIGKEKPQGSKDMGSYSVPVFTPEQQARLGIDDQGLIRDDQAPAAKRTHKPPRKEKPRGMKDMGSYAVSIYTAEQQARLGVDSRGAKISPYEVSSSQPKGPAVKEMPQGARDMGSFSVPVYTPEQQARLGVDERGVIRDSQAPATRKVHRPAMKEKPRGMKDMGCYAVSVYTAEQQARLGVDYRGAQLVPEPVQAVSARPGAGKEKPQGFKDMGLFSVPVYTNEQQARLGVDERGVVRDSQAPITTKPHRPPMKEKPRGMQDMGSYAVSVYTVEQQARLGVDARGAKRCPEAPKVQLERGSTGKEKPQGSKDMGSYSVPVFTPEQQARLGVDERGVLRDPLAPVSQKAHTPPKKEKPRGMKDMGSFAVSVYTSEQQARLGVDSRGVKVSPEPALVKTTKTGSVGKENPQGFKDMGSYSVPVFTSEQQARLSVDKLGFRFDGQVRRPLKSLSGPPQKEKPKCMKDMGAYAIGVYSAEQQARLGVNERGFSLALAAKVSSSPAQGASRKELPQGVQDMGSYSVAAYTPEQQARLGIDARGMVRDAQAPIAKRPHKPPMKEKPRGMQDMGSYAVSVYTAEQQARLGVDARGSKLLPELAQPRLVEGGPGQKERPQGAKDMGSYSIPVFTPEQQARLKVDERGLALDGQVKGISKRISGPPQKEKPKGMKNMGLFAVGDAELIEMPGSQAMSLDDAVQNLISNFDPFKPRLCILGGTTFSNSTNEALVRCLAQKLDAKFRERIVVLTGGMKGVQQTFGESLTSMPLFNLVPCGGSSAGRDGQDLQVGKDLEQRKKVFGKIGTVYLSIEGGPGVAQEARDAFANGAFVIPMARSEGASAGAMGFPTKALEAPDWASDNDWGKLANPDIPVEMSAQAVVDLLDTFLSREADPESEGEVAGKMMFSVRTMGGREAEISVRPSSSTEDVLRKTVKSLGLSKAPRLLTPTGSLLNISKDVTVESAGLESGMELTCARLNTIKLRRHLYDRSGAYMSSDIIELERSIAFRAQQEQLLEALPTSKAPTFALAALDPSAAPPATWGDAGREVDIGSPVQHYFWGEQVCQLMVQAP